MTFGVMPKRKSSVGRVVRSFVCKDFYALGGAIELVECWPRVIRFVFLRYQVGAL